jgi:nucleoid-associated protein YejK
LFLLEYSGGVEELLIELNGVQNERTGVFGFCQENSRKKDRKKYEKQSTSRLERNTKSNRQSTKPMEKESTKYQTDGNSRKEVPDHLRVLCLK